MRSKLAISKCSLVMMAAGAAIISSPALALNIFVCEPEWKAFLESHAPNATIYSATTAKQDPHYVQARPSLIAKMRQADMAMCSGAELEVGWLPMLQNRSGNSAVQNGAQSMIYATDFVRMLDSHEHVDRSMGDIHAHGNPHVQFAANDMIPLSRKVTERLKAIDPDNAQSYQVNGMKFRAQWQKKLNEWEQKAQPLQGKRVVGYHSTYRYLFDWLGMVQVADLEPKPGISPTTSHLQSLTKLDADSFDAIVYSSHQDQRPAKWLQEHTDKPVIQLPLTVSEGESLDEMYDQVIDDLLDVLVPPVPVKI
ncbi:zinc ABC transporter substrate-binding protein [Vibrio diabolicus]|uniref:metal ABC transporter solute-binding protein, Zn/Mn family n=1 Tax=Vibrio TaxID=662 RepID=UPI001F337FA8|nr:MULTISPECIES: zinc ABC transporter substrate-binding protein [Vibrio]MCF7453362.1 zinc ABC transporter substrate-binding protein [Vibrio sp. A1-1]MCG9227953.1 zinc ABC transporter substrate-binding protein [Vibrio diabolicus]MCG9570033.1 zinc ABC transporter substrate-binding protein [Vibrio diabolicus]MCG9591501.1 zinc ABC transporter substrate-binding protein [Vibrio diabolicus]MCG9773218.1 zinc ABC transporter substrate-binding protein [Vibrio diabolicus]